MKAPPITLGSASATTVVNCIIGIIAGIVISASSGCDDDDVVKHYRGVVQEGFENLDFRRCGSKEYWWWAEPPRLSDVEGMVELFAAFKSERANDPPDPSLGTRLVQLYVEVLGRVSKDQHMEYSTRIEFTAIKLVEKDIPSDCQMFEP